MWEVLGVVGAVIPDEAVEAAARAAAKDDAEPNWYLDTERFRDAWRIRMRAALEAAAPHLLAAAWDEGFGRGTLSQFEESTNPYREARK